MNAITYTEIFPLIKNGKLWLGHGPMGKDMLFDVPKDYAQELVETKNEGCLQDRRSKAGWEMSSPTSIMQCEMKN